MVRDSRRKFTRDDLEFLLVLVGQAAAEPRDRPAPGEGRGGRRARGARAASRATCTTASSRRSPASTCASRRRSCSCSAIPTRVPKALEDLHAGGRQRLPRGPSLPDGAAHGEPAGGRSGLDARSARRGVLDPRAPDACTWPGRQADPGLPTSTAYELTQIVREALHNAVRHGQATQAIVKLGRATVARLPGHPGQRAAASRTATAASMRTASSKPPSLPGRSASAPRRSADRCGSGAGRTGRRGLAPDPRGGGRASVDTRWRGYRR